VFIQYLGWNAYFQALWNEEERSGCVAARVVAQHRGRWRVAGEFGESWAEASGRLRHESENGGDWPAVGDWVAAEICGESTSAIIQQVLPRKSKFSRKQAGKRIAEQVLAANIDLAIIVAALDDEFNVRRIERYVAQCWESGARPVLVLNKADACATPCEHVEEIRGLAIGAPPFVLSARTGDGMPAFEASLVKGQTIVFLGSSGVGKSTLVNWLLHEEKQSTRAVRTTDSRGRHTTTARELFVLPGGGMVIDTPGLRELQLWDAGEGVSQAFADIEELAAQCRFRDCTHTSEPGCAVRTALDEGTLDAQRLESQRKLEREQEFLLRKMDPERQHEYKKRIRILFKAIRQNTQSRNKGKN